MEEQFVVLRFPEVSGGFEHRGPGTLSGAGGTLSLEVETPSLSPREQRDLQRDPQTAAIAPVMPMRLIEPFEAEEENDEPEAEAEAAGATGGFPVWGIRAVKANASPFDGSGVTVAVLDTGIEKDHPAFKGVDLVRRNFTDESDDDRKGHGTHCAGTIFGQKVGRRRIGVAPNIKRALIGKVLGKGGNTSMTVIEAITWALDGEASIISMSLGIDFPGYVDRLVQRGLKIQPATSRALEGYRANINLFSRMADYIRARRIEGKGAIIIAASGNESSRPDYEIAVSPPAAGTDILAVGALRRTTGGLDVASFSNNGVVLSAPGVSILSAHLNGRLRALSGTSMATPHVAGVAALWAQKQLDEDGAIDIELLKGQLLASGTRTPLVSSVERDDVGAGLVQAPLGQF